MGKRRGERPKCADCLIDTSDIDEFYMVKDEVWSYAWRTSRPPPPTLAPLRFELEYVGPWSGRFLCIGCLERRIGRT
jgi:hypothetical protein